MFSKINKNDLGIWTQFKNGDNKAFELIYNENVIHLYHYGQKFTKDIIIIEDSIQDLFAEIYKNRKNLGETDNILFYLILSFKRKLIRNLKKEKHYIPNENFDSMHFEFTWPEENRIIQNETVIQQSKLLIKAQNHLSSRQKEAIYLRFSKELDYTKIAELMDISIEACRNLISSAIKEMKTALHQPLK
jgi:RNA polymerase sigma factor (sigma-70 family)